jgi:hypothetical protein
MDRSYRGDLLKDAVGHVFRPYFDRAGKKQISGLRIWQGQIAGDLSTADLM